MSRSHSTLPPEDRILLTEALDAALRAIGALEGRHRSDLDQDWMLAAAIERTLEIIGEAASKVSPLSRQRWPDLPWREIIGMRNRLIHGYSSVDHDIVWDVVTYDLPALVARLEKMLGPPSS